jgi:hypothetical protein
MAWVHIGGITRLGVLVVVMPKAKAIHYRHPVLGYHSCGMGDPRTVKMTDNAEDVTCQRCLSTITGQKNGGRPVSKDSMVKGRAAWSMDAEEWDWLNAQASKAETLRNAIRLYRQGNC